ncbi:tetratricopeptide repeat protein [Ancylomarina longa]|uniref:Tetratricopeptide repeat protein n=1 Tax=Ancylomarina longa TaxID=2487017 RepID=A0A434AEU9_9BACT|nr:tetratricopeptide repeat protein [Ancylomarina longa]RUT72862.1 tetratricopeptide repeat protein [Ancylomarina longa]
MKKISLILLILIIGTNVYSQNYFENFKKYQASGDTLRQKELLEKWKQEKPNDSELYTSLFNYYFQKSRNEVLILASGTPPRGQKYLELKDSTNQVAGFISSKIDYEKSNLKLAFESIDKGIKLYPNRLDMRFGKIYVLGQIKDWRNFTNEIIVTVDYSSKNNNEWTWTLNEKRKDGKDFFLGSLQDYQMQLYNTMDDELLHNMREIAQAVLKYYPNHIESLSNSSITFLVEKKYEKALVPLKKAEEINPKDFIVLNNIAYCYKEMNDKDLAIEYYEKVVKYGDKRAIEQAKNEIEKLK